MKTKKYLVRDPKALDLMFYSNYDDNFIFNKAMSLLSILDLGDEYKLLAEKSKLPPFEINRKFFEALEAEIYFSEFHFFESFWGLAIAIFQDSPHWLYLTTYETKEIKEKVSAFLNEDVKTLTNDRLTNFNDLVNQAIYTDYTFTEKVRPNWQTNIDNILWALQRIGRKYLDAKEYNGYKHGLRVMTGPTSFAIYPDGEPDKASGISSDHSLIFLETQSKGEKELTVHQTVKHFNLNESINHILLLNMMTSTIKSTRLAKLKGESKADNIYTFFDLDRDGLLNEGGKTQWSTTA